MNEIVIEYLYRISIDQYLGAYLGTVPMMFPFHG